MAFRSTAKEKGDYYAPASSSSKSSSSRYSGRNGESSTRGKTWRKVLYRRQPFADNHVDETFLRELKTNVNVVKRNYWAMVKSTANITQEILIVLIFCIVFKFTHDVVGAPPTATVERSGIIVAHTDETQAAQLQKSATKPLLDHAIKERWFQILMIINVSTVILGYTLELILWPSHFTIHNVGQAVKNCALFIVIVLVFSPVLRTLTKTFSDDTIYALTIWLFLIHLMFYDYKFVEVLWFYGTLSLNAAIFASVLLASRLTSNSHSFAIVTFAIALFGVFPIFRHAVRLYSQKLHLVFTVLLFFLVWRMLNEIAYFLTVIYVVSIFIINIVAPGFFISLQKLKREITGPWDIAKVEHQNEEEMNMIMNNLIRQQQFQQQQFNHRWPQNSAVGNASFIRKNINDLTLHRRSMSMQSLSELGNR